MNTTDYFGDWLKAIDKTELIKVINWLNRDNICSSIENVFKAFRLCPYKFIVANKKTLIPLVWNYEDTEKMGTLYYGKQIECRDLLQ